MSLTYGCVENCITQPGKENKKYFLNIERYSIIKLPMINLLLKGCVNDYQQKSFLCFK
jgi:hypothetical protein